MRLTTIGSLLSGLLLCCPVLAMPSLESFGLGLRAETDGGNEQMEACTLANSASANASVQLASWVECSINGVFPYPANGQWDRIFASTFSSALKATFNDTHYGYDGWLKLYQSFNVTIGKNFAPFRHGVINTVAIPNANGDKGGFVYVLGWEGGWHTLLKRDLYFTDALFAVVNDYGGRREIVEFRESSNIPNTASLPPPQNWTCTFC